MYLDLLGRRARRAAAAALALLLACHICALARAAEPGGVDVILLMDASAMTALSGAAAEEPWLACPCLNPEHFYLKPVAVDAEEAAAGATFPRAAPLAAGEAAGAGELSVYDEAVGAWVALSLEREYRFCHSFLSEPEAHGWQPWRYHFTRDENGAPVRIACSEACSCFGREQAAKALARMLAAAVLAENGENRVAFCAFGEAGSSRWSCPLTGTLADVLACIDASPVQRGGDHAAGLARALRLLNRRPLSERIRRRAAVVVLSGGEAFPAGNAARAVRLADALKARRGAETPAVFGTALAPEERRGCGAEVIVLGFWDGGSALIDALASGPDARFCMEDPAAAEAAAAAVLERAMESAPGI